MSFNKIKNGLSFARSHIALIIPAAAVFVVLCVFVVRVFFINIVVVNGVSMEPTLLQGERWIMSRTDRSCDAGDIIVYRPSEDSKNLSVSRVVAVAGDSVYIDFSTGYLYINGERRDESYVSGPIKTGGRYISSLIDSGNYGMSEPFVIEQGKVFVLGDNRSNSRDSREFGQISLELVKGTVTRKVK